MKKGIIAFIIAMAIMKLCTLLNSNAYAGKRLHHEDDYNTKWCEQQEGVREKTLFNGSRVDCVTPDGYAVEADFANKFNEAVGQSLHYAAVTGLSPGILLIVEDWERDKKYVERLFQTIKFTCPAIRVWFIDPEFLEMSSLPFGRPDTIYFES